MPQVSNLINQFLSHSSWVHIYNCHVQSSWKICKLKCIFYVEGFDIAEMFNFFVEDHRSEVCSSYMNSSCTYQVTRRFMQTPLLVHTVKLWITKIRSTFLMMLKSQSMPKTSSVPSWLTGIFPQILTKFIKYQQKYVESSVKASFTSEVEFKSKAFYNRQFVQLKINSKHKYL